MNFKDLRTSTKISTSTKRALVLTLLMMTTMVAGFLLAAPSLSMAQQTNTGTATVSTPPPLTLEEQQQQERLQSMMAATTRNLQQGQIQVDGLVYTPRWSNPVWVQPDSLSIAFAYCLPGEFAESGQQILGSSDLEVLESYSLALTNDLTGWLMVVENQNQTDRFPAAVGAICSSDANEPETRILSPQEQIVINNIIQQFTTIRTTQITNITQVINIINNVTTNGTGTPSTNGTGGNGTGGPIIQPPSTNGTGGNGTGGGGVETPETLSVIAEYDTDEEDPPNSMLFEASADGGSSPYTYHWDFGDGTTGDGNAPFHVYENPGTYTATVTVTDATGQTASDSTPPLTIGDPETTEGGEGATTTPETPTARTEGEEAGTTAEQPPAETATEGEGATTTTTRPSTTALDTLGQ